LELFKMFESSLFSNEQARPLFGGSRQATWKRLSKLVELGFIERRGHRYKISASGKALMSACSGALRGLLTNLVLAENRSAAGELLTLAREGLELMYAKGMIQPVEQSRYQRLVDALAKEIEAKVA
jgi:hypothetical protein